MKHFLISILMVLSINQAMAADKLTVLLDWFVNPDHAPLIIAAEKGYFEAEGLEVELIAPADPAAPPRLVAAGKGDIAISYQPNLYTQVQEGLPLSWVGTLVETPLNALVVLKDGPIESLSDLKGTKIGFSVGGFEDALLGAMLKTVDIGLDEVELINVNFSLSPSIISGNVDAVIGAFRNFELNQMDIVGKPGLAFFPEENGVPIYDELILITHRDRANDLQITKFLRAIEAATIYLTNHPEDALEIFVTAHPDLNDELNRRAWFDTLPRFAKRPSAFDTARYVRFGEFMAKSGLIKTAPEISALNARQ